MFFLCCLILIYREFNFFSVYVNGLGLNLFTDMFLFVLLIFLINILCLKESLICLGREEWVVGFWMYFFVLVVWFWNGCIEEKCFDVWSSNGFVGRDNFRKVEVLFEDRLRCSFLLFKIYVVFRLFLLRIILEIVFVGGNKLFISFFGNSWNLYKKNKY